MYYTTNLDIMAEMNLDLVSYSIVAICYNYKKQGLDMFISKDKLAEKFKVSRPTIFRKLKILKEKNYIQEDSNNKIILTNDAILMLENENTPSQIDTVLYQNDTIGKEDSIKMIQLQSQNDTIQSQNDTIDSIKMIPYNNSIINIVDINKDNSVIPNTTIELNNEFRHLGLPVITDTQLSKIIEQGYSFEDLESIMIQMLAWKKVKTIKSTYFTALNWLRRKKDENKAEDGSMKLRV